MNDDNALSRRTVLAKVAEYFHGDQPHVGSFVECDDEVCDLAKRALDAYVPPQPRRRPSYVDLPVDAEGFVRTSPEDPINGVLFAEVRDFNRKHGVETRAVRPT